MNEIIHEYQNDRIDFILCQLRFRYQYKAFLRKVKIQGMGTRVFIILTKSKFKLERCGGIKLLFCEQFGSLCLQIKSHSRLNFFKAE